MNRNDAGRDFMNPYFHILEPRPRLTAVDKNVGVWVVGGECQVRQDEPNWIVLVDQGNYLAVEMDVHHMGFSWPEVGRR
jgi:hypothetical protein